jgi:hypothetical protein
VLVQALHQSITVVGGSIGSNDLALRQEFETLFREPANRVPPSIPAEARHSSYTETMTAYVLLQMLTGWLGGIADAEKVRAEISEGARLYAERQELRSFLSSGKPPAAQPS